jgi:hypothetical protein
MTTPINDPLLAERLNLLLQAKGRTNRHYEVTYFGEPDKSDPLNEFAIMSAVVIDNGVKRGWKVRTLNTRRGVNRCEVIIEKLLADLADAIDANPDGQAPTLKGTDPFLLERLDPANAHEFVSNGLDRRIPAFSEASIPLFDRRTYSSVPTCILRDMAPAGGQGWPKATAHLRGAKRP